MSRSSRSPTIQDRGRDAVPRRYPPGASARAERGAVLRPARRAVDGRGRVHAESGWSRGAAGRRSRVESGLSPWGQRIGEFLEAVGTRACDECIRALPEGDTLLAHPSRQPMMLIETDACRERQVGRHPDQHPSPVPVVDVEIVLDDPSLGDVKVPAIGALVTDSGQDAAGSRALRMTTTWSGFAPLK